MKKKTLEPRPLSLTVSTPLSKTQKVSDRSCEGPADRSIDVYSFGVLLWFLGTAEPPYSELADVNAFQLMDMVGKGYRPTTHREQVSSLSRAYKSFAFERCKAFCKKTPSDLNFGGHCHKLALNGN